MKHTDRTGLVEQILKEDLNLTNEQVAVAAGLTEEQGIQLWRNLGFPDPGDEAVFGKSDIQAASIVAATIDHGFMDERTIFRLTRALGQTMARLADWEVTILVDQLESDVSEGKRDSRLDAALAMTGSASKEFDRLLLHVWHRHLAAAAMRIETRGSNEELLSTTMTVGFADMTRFTALSNRLDHVELAEVVEEFETRCGDIVTAGGGRIIKTLGDAMLFVHADPIEATHVSLDVLAGIRSRPNLPDVRVGLATGSVVSRLGDVFGPPVNLAARLSNVARANRILVDRETADAIAGEFDTRVLPPRPIKGFGNISPITVTERRGFTVR
ncbi:MAG: adenylate/guanylate cyclase domain-containing protein [Actinomycetales bacterium]|nr:adenylate/guanylate cyclase domain-containing protein [Actinomycetales bacterium]